MFTVSVVSERMPLRKAAHERQDLAMRTYIIFGKIDV
jgi:hypothetical protein